MKKKIVILSVVLLHVLCSGSFANGSGDKVLATIGDQNVTQKDLDTFLQKIPEPFRKAFRKKALYQMIETQVFYRRALAEGLDKSPEFQTRLKRERQRLLAAYFIEKKIRPRAKVSHAEVQKYYQQHKSEFVSAERVKVKEWAFENEAEASNARMSLAGAKSGADMPSKLRAQLQKQRVLWLEKGKILGQIERAVFSLNPGQISDVIKWNKKYILFQVVEKKAPGIRSLKEVEGYILRKLEKEKMERLKDSYFRKAGVRILANDLAH